MKGKQIVKLCSIMVQDDDDIFCTVLVVFIIRFIKQFLSFRTSVEPTIYFFSTPRHLSVPLHCTISNRLVSFAHWISWKYVSNSHFLLPFVSLSVPDSPSLSLFHVTRMGLTRSVRVQVGYDKV